MRFCPKCGAEINDTESKFCASCGTMLPQESSAKDNAAPSVAALSGLGSSGEPSQHSRSAPSTGQASHTTPQKDSASQNGVADFFSSPFVKDATGSEAPLFSAVFAGDTAPASSGGPPAKSSSASLFDQDSPVPVQKIQLNLSEIGDMLDTPAPSSSQDASAAPVFPGVAKTVEPDFFAEAAPAETAPNLASDLFSGAQTLAAEEPFAAETIADELFKDAAPLKEAPAASADSLFSSPKPAPTHEDHFSSSRPASKPASAPKPKEVYQRMAVEPPPQAMGTPDVSPVAPAQANTEAAPVQQMPEPVPIQQLTQPAPIQQIPPTPPGGSILPEPSTAARRPSPQRRAPAPPSHSQRNTGHLVRNLLIGILAALVLLFGAILGFLYWQNRPSKTIDTFTEALSQRDYEALSTSVAVVDVTASGSEGWIALCDAFEEEASRMDLSKEMARVSANSTQSNFKYPSVRLVGKPLFLFIQQYHVQIHGVSVLVPAAAEGITLRLNAGDEFTDPAGVLDPQGMLYEGILPGHYSAVVSYPDGTVNNYTVSAFAISEPNALDAATSDAGEDSAPVFANLTIENCLSDDAQIFLNEQETPIKPIDGVVQLEQVELGASITIKAVVDDSTQVASVTFVDPNVTTLSFGEYTTTEGPPDTSKAPDAEVTSEEIDQVLVPFYKSYLEAINAQSLSGIQYSTEANNQKLQGRISTPANQANTYTFASAAADPASIVAKTDGDTPTVEFIATCAFSYVPKEDTANVQTGSNRQSVKMVYTDGKWLVDSFTNA